MQFGVAEQPDSGVVFQPNINVNHQHKILGVARILVSIQQLAKSRSAEAIISHGRLWIKLEQVLTQRLIVHSSKTQKDISNWRMAALEDEDLKPAPFRFSSILSLLYEQLRAGIRNEVDGLARRLKP